MGVEKAGMKKALSKCQWVLVKNDIYMYIYMYIYVYIYRERCTLHVSKSSVTSTADKPIQAVFKACLVAMRFEYPLTCLALLAAAEGTAITLMWQWFPPLFLSVRWRSKPTSSMPKEA